MFIYISSIPRIISTLVEAYRFVKKSLPIEFSNFLQFLIEYAIGDIYLIFKCYMHILHLNKNMMKLKDLIGGDLIPIV